jgi:hypothetical protein
MAYFALANKAKPPMTIAETHFHEETDDPLLADRRNFFKAKLGTRDRLEIERLLFAGNSLDKARAMFAAFGRKRSRARLTIRQRTLMLQQWPRRAP